eukprot:3863479-Rhodomonas_salina.1
MAVPFEQRVVHVQTASLDLLGPRHGVMGPEASWGDKTRCECTPSKHLAHTSTQHFSVGCTCPFCLDLAASIGANGIISDQRWDEMMIDKRPGSHAESDLTLLS